MSSEQIGNNKNTFGSQAMSIAAFPLGMEVINGAKLLKSNHQIGKILGKDWKPNFANLKNNLKGDTFSRNLALADNYETYTSAKKTLAKEIKKFKKQGLSIKDIKETDAYKNFNDASNNIKNGKSLCAVADTKGFRKTVGSSIKKGFKNPMTWAFTLLEATPEIINKVIPAFKEKGFKEGMKEAGKTAVKAGADMATYVASSAVGRAVGAFIGGTIGSIFPGAGTAAGASVGGNIGSMIAISIGNIVKGKIFKPKEETQQPENIQYDNKNRSYYA